MRKMVLSLLMWIGFTGGIQAAFYETSIRNNGVVSSGNGYTTNDVSVTLISFSPNSPVVNDCNITIHPYARGRCSSSIYVYSVRADGFTYYSAFAVALFTNVTPPCCDVNMYYASTLGELVPLMRNNGAFGKTVTLRLSIPSNAMGLKTCIITAYGNQQGSSYFAGPYDCTPVVPIDTTCDIVDTNASIDFGTLSNDVSTKKSSSSFRVNCSGDAKLRIKFDKDISRLSLSNDGLLYSSLKIRDSISNISGNDIFVSVSAGSQEIFIDAEFHNNGSSHVGEFSASAVAIIEIA
ncbi:hypothetical protein IM817_01450 [Serratia marcescens]|uniref:MrpH family fimbial adhesin n=1 Tax=Serratia marcescens TaxID=615 RepID=UPI001C579643|nr:hypothetical protein [Serratia marcescens]QXX96923.1 hypothetical protein IM817_01450 [Serratia marcescens]